MKILLVDADSTIPNLALMKLSTFHKNQGNEVSLKQLNIPYYPNRKRTMHRLPTGYDKIYCSVIFDDSINWVRKENIIFGGTGYSLSVKLPEYIEKLEPDYSLYPDNNASYGFISRGCIKKCSFCKVPQKEGGIHQVNTVENIVRHKKVFFMDNNFLALPNHKEILNELIKNKIKCKFSQGLDIGLVDEENSILLSKLRYIGSYTFAFDNWSYLSQMEKKLPLLSWRKDWQLKFFVYCSPEMKISNITKRICYLKDKSCLPYIMRDVSCWKSPNNFFYIDIAAWCNQVGIFKKMTFSDFLEKRYLSKKSQNRIKSSREIWDRNIK